MTTRFLLILIALFWCTLASASEIINDFEQTESWDSMPITSSQLSDKPNTNTNQSENKEQNKKAETPANKQKRSRLGGMFDLLLPSGLRDNH